MINSHIFPWTFSSIGDFQYMGCRRETMISPNWRFTVLDAPWGRICQLLFCTTVPSTHALSDFIPGRDCPWLQLHGEDSIWVSGRRSPSNMPCRLRGSWFCRDVLIGDFTCKHARMYIIFYCCPVKLLWANKIRADTSHEVSALLVIFVFDKKIYNHEHS